MPTHWGYGFNVQIWGEHSLVHNSSFHLYCDPGPAVSKSRSRKLSGHMGGEGWARWGVVDDT